MSARRRTVRTLIGLLLIALPVTAATEETADIYESITAVAIGPVFLTPAQRKWLDGRRLAAPVDTVSDSTDKTAGVAQSVVIKPAGYIVSSSGRRSEWSDGDFIESTAANAAISFPGEVDLLRHQNDADDDKVDDGDDQSDN